MSTSIDTGALLFELGTEELPAGPLQTMATALHDGIVQGFAELGLQCKHSRWFATPRRLAVAIDGLQTSAPDQVKTVLGPPAANSKDADGNWTGAATGFARKQGIGPEQLEIIETDKGARVGVTITQAGAQASVVASDVITAALANVPVAKRMRWGRERDEFLRPVQWLTALLDNNVIPLTAFGLTSDRITRGHRFHHPDVVTLNHANEYQESLRKAFVIADFAERRQLISAQVEQAAELQSAIAVIGDNLLDEVTGLVEWPVAMLGNFDSDFLKVPAQALISAMREHQKYFHVLDHDGQLLPSFITVSNIESSCPETVIKGNEKVIRPRLADAAFFFENDKKTPLAQRIERLSSVVFQHQLGSLAEKAERISSLSASLAHQLQGQPDLASRGAELAKCDLVSEMVLEFPELQGIAGAHYASHDGESEIVVECIEQHYWPKFAGDALPKSREAAAVALADRLDTLVGIFGIGQLPTGSKDPFGLRRAALAVIRILVDRDVDLDLKALAEEAVAAYPPGLLAASTAADVADYTLERLRSWYEDMNISVDVLRAVLATGITAPAEIDRRVRAIDSFASTDDATALAAANKRVANILAKVEGGVSGDVEEALFAQAEERTLADSLTAITDANRPLIAGRNYSEALENLATLRAPVDAFFDQVMVNAEDPALRQNRLRLLAALRAQFVQIADIAHLTASN